MTLLLEAKSVGKKYARSLERSLAYGARDVVLETFGRRDGSSLRADEFWALQDVSFTLDRGQCLAVLGANGAGKSTLLKVISGILLPDTGEVRRHGHLEKMIEMSAGFSPSLTGRENVQLKARLMGLTSGDAARRLADVIAFSELDAAAIDMPVQFYSSGMKARLGFALSAAMAPDILLIDEVLAVGDLGFRMKCYARVDEMRARSAVVLVSHSMNHVSRMASATLVLHKGKAVHYGSVQEGIARYQELVGGKALQKEIAYNGDRIAVELLAGGERVERGAEISYGAPLAVRGVHRAAEPVTLSVILHQTGGEPFVDWSSKRSAFEARPHVAFEAELGAAEICPGYYHLSVVGFAASGKQLFLSEPYRFRVVGDYHTSIKLQPRGRWREHTPDRAYYQALHERDRAFQTNNWLLDDADAIRRFAGRRLIELGCGNGLFLEKAASHWDEVIGVDWARSPQIDRILAACRNVRFVAASVAEYRPESRADVVCSADFLEHLPADQLPELLRSIHGFGAVGYHKIACYDDGHSHLSVLPPDQWLELFRGATGDERYRIVSDTPRKGKVENRVVVISNGPAT